MRRLLLYLLSLLFVSSAFCQISSHDIWFVIADPVGACLNGQAMQYNYLNGNFWGCKNSVWTQVSGGGGGGTVSPATAGQVAVYTAATTVGGNSDFYWRETPTVTGMTGLQLGLPEPDLSCCDGPGNAFSVIQEPTSSVQINYVTAGGAPSYIEQTFYRSRGTTTVPTNIAAGDFLHVVDYYMFSGGAYTFVGNTWAKDDPDGSGSLLLNWATDSATTPLIGSQLLLKHNAQLILRDDLSNTWGLHPITATESELNNGTIVSAGGSLIQLDVGNLMDSGLSASLPVQTNASKVLVSSAIDLSGSQATGTLAAGREPAHTGDMTNSAGSLATTVSKVGGVAISSMLSCQILDNAICTSAVSSGNPNFLTTAANTVLPINGGTTPLVMFIAGVYQSLNTNVTLTVPSTASVPQWILVKQDLANANLVAADFLAMNTAPAYAYTAPTCPSPGTALSSTNPAFWFDLSTNLSKLCTSNGGAYSASPAIVIGVVWVDATPKVLSVAMEPYRLNPYKRFELFGTGADGTLTITSGTTTIDIHKQYASVILSAGTLTHTLVANNLASVGISIQSQNPVLVFGTGTIQGNVLGTNGGAGSTGSGAGGQGANFSSTAGGGGGSGTTSAAGGAGGGRMTFLRLTSASAGGNGGAATPTAGSAGLAIYTLPPQVYLAYPCAGPGGGAGAGDGTNVGGTGGKGGGEIWIKSPSIVVDTGGSITANGGNGTNGVGGNAGAGGGGGGGCVILNAGYIFSTNGTVTASNGTAGTGVGTGKNGGDGGTGLVQLNRLW